MPPSDDARGLYCPLHRAAVNRRGVHAAYAPRRMGGLQPADTGEPLRGVFPMSNEYECPAAHGTALRAPCPSLLPAEARPLEQPLVLRGGERHHREPRQPREVRGLEHRIALERGE